MVLAMNVADGSYMLVVESYVGWISHNDADEIDSKTRARVVYGTYIKPWAVVITKPLSALISFCWGPENKTSFPPYESNTDDSAT